MSWVTTASGGFATNPREFDLFYMDPDDGPPAWWRFRYRVMTDGQPDWVKGWSEFQKQKWYDVDVRAAGIPAEAKAVFLHCMMNITRPGNLSGSHELWATCCAPSAKETIDTAKDDTGRAYGEKTFRELTNGPSRRTQQGSWVALEDSKFSVRAFYSGPARWSYPNNPGYMIRISAAAYQI